MAIDRINDLLDQQHETPDTRGDLKRIERMKKRQRITERLKRG